MPGDFRDGGIGLSVSSLLTPPAQEAFGAISESIKPHARKGTQWRCPKPQHPCAAIAASW